MSKKKVENQYEVDKKGLQDSLRSFQNKFDVYTREKLSLVIQLTRMAKNKKYPLRLSDFLADDDIQIDEINEENFRRILEDYGITIPPDDSDEDLDVESISSQDDTINYDNKPFILSAEQSKSVQSILNNLLNQAIKRDKQLQEKKYRDTMIKYLVAAQLQIIFPNQDCLVSNTIAEDGSINQSGDLVINNIGIHCAILPDDFLMEKCKENIDADLRPVIITLNKNVIIALQCIEDADLKDEVEVWDIQQFLSTSILERSLFDESKRNSILKDIIDRYNNIIDEVENDPSLKIEFETR